MQVTINESNWGWVVVAAVALVWLAWLIGNGVRAKDTAEQIRRDRELASSQFEKRLRDSLAESRIEIRRLIEAESKAELREWKSVYSARIRQDAVNRSKAVLAGKLAENIAPYLPTFPYNPKDARFLGNPIDFIVFDGLDEGDLSEIVFLEIKSQNSRMTERQKAIKSVIEQGHVYFQEIRVDGAEIVLDLPESPGDTEI